MQSISIMEAGLSSEVFNHPGGGVSHRSLLPGQVPVNVHTELLLQLLDDEVGVAQAFAIQLNIWNLSGFRVKLFGVNILIFDS